MDLAKTLFSVRSQHFANTANKTDKRVKQLNMFRIAGPGPVSFPVEGRVVEMHTMNYEFDFDSDTDFST